MEQPIRAIIEKIWQCRSTADFDHAKALFEEANSLDNSKNPAERGELLRVYAQIKRDQGAMNESLDLLEQAVKLLVPVVPRLRQAHIIRHIADIHRELGNLEEAERNYKVVLAVHREEGDNASPNFANALRGYALLHEEMNIKTNADSIWRQAMEIYVLYGLEEGAQECQSYLSRAEQS